MWSAVSGGPYLKGKWDTQEGFGRFLAFSGARRSVTKYLGMAYGSGVL
jgi:hypothetical protein